MKRTKARGPVQRDAKEVLAEVLGKLTGKLDAPAVSTSAKENRRGNTVGPNRDRLTVGVDLGEHWSQYCILGLAGETLAEGQLRTTQEDIREFVQAITAVSVMLKLLICGVRRGVVRVPVRAFFQKLLQLCPGVRRQLGGIAFRRLLMLRGQLRNSDRQQRRVPFQHAHQTLGAINSYVNRQHRTSVRISSPA
jgi:hypothetical protein